MGEDKLEKIEKIILDKKIGSFRSVPLSYSLPRFPTYFLGIGV